MKKVLFTFLLVIGIQFVNNVYAQSLSDIYMIGTSSTIPSSYRGIFDGFGKYVNPQTPYTKGSGISFSLGKVSKDYEMILHHVNYLKSTKPDKVIADLPISALKNLRIIDIDDFIATKSREQVWAWMIKNSDKRVWVIDRNDFYKSSPSCIICDRMMLVETEIWLGNVPDEVLNP